MTNSRRRVAVVGAGMAGAACGRRLNDAGASVHLFEKSRGVGGRMATRRSRWTDDAGEEHEAAFDHGAPGFSAHSAAFASFVRQHAQAGAVVRWRPRTAAGGSASLDGQEHWIATPRMPELCARLIDELPVTLSREAPQDEVHAMLLSALADFVGEAPNWRLCGAHRWRYASVARPGHIVRGSDLHMREPWEQAGAWKK